jgi:hypothetical protein
MASLANLESDVIHLTRSTTGRLFSELTPPQIVSYEDDERLSPEQRLHELRAVRQSLYNTSHILGLVFAQLSAANSHCTSIRRELDHVRSQLDHAIKKKERGSKKIKARFLTSRALRAEFDREDAERLENEQRTVEKNKQRELERVEATKWIQREGCERVFFGSMSSYKKDDLQALALALDISGTGTKEELKAHITMKFDTSPELKEHHRFQGLFNCSRST